MWNINKKINKILNLKKLPINKNRVNQNQKIIKKFFHVKYKIHNLVKLKVKMNLKN